MIAPPTKAPVIDQAPGRRVLYQHFVVSMEDLPQTIQRSMAALYERITHSGIVPAGPPFVTYYSAAAPWEVDICAPVATPITPHNDFNYVELPATRVVSLVHVGPYEQLGRTYDEIESFIRERGLRKNGPPRETYLSPPNTPSDQVQTIVEWPIE